MKKMILGKIFMMYAKNGNTEKMKALLESGTTLSDKKMRKGVWLACMGNNADIVALLLDRGVKMEVKKNFLTYGPSDFLSTVSGEGHTAVAKVLLDHGVDPNVKGYGPACFSREPIFEATLKGHIETAKVLLEYGANP